MHTRYNTSEHRNWLDYNFHRIAGKLFMYIIHPRCRNYNNLIYYHSYIVFITRTIHFRFFVRVANGRKIYSFAFIWEHKQQIYVSKKKKKTFRAVFDIMVKKINTNTTKCVTFWRISYNQFLSNHQFQEI